MTAATTKFIKLVCGELKPQGANLDVINGNCVADIKVSFDHLLLPDFLHLYLCLPQFII